MNETKSLTPESAALLEERFGSFGDAVIDEVHLYFPRKTLERRAVIRVLAAQATADTSWLAITFEVNSLEEFKLSEGQVSNIVLSDGLRVHHLMNLCWLDFAPYSTETATLDDIRRSHQYFAGVSCTYRVEAIGATDR